MLPSCRFELTGSWDDPPDPLGNSFDPDPPMGSGPSMDSGPLLGSFPSPSPE